MAKKMTRRDLLATGIGVGIGAVTPRLPMLEDKPRCHGNLSTHCCWIAGKVCEYLGENIVEGRRWACKLYLKHGSWAAVHASEEHRHLRTVHWKGTTMHGMLCGDWPQEFPVTNEMRCCYETRPEVIARVENASH